MYSYDKIINILNKFKYDSLKEKYKLKSSAFSRKRCMTFTDLCYCILNKKGKTLTMELDDYFMAKGLPELIISKQAFSEQRQNLNPEIFRVLNDDYIKEIYMDVKHPVKTYLGYVVLGADGTTIELPNTKEMQEEYGTAVSNKRSNRNSAKAKASAIYDVINNIMIDAQIDRYNKSERELVKRNILKASELLGEAPTITIFDRGYISIELMYLMLKQQKKFLFRVPTDKYKKEIESIKGEDEKINITINESRLRGIKNTKERSELRKEKALKVRLVKYKLDTGETEYLITNLEKEEISSKELGELYFKRWKIEQAFDVLKNKLYIENISGKSKIVIEQDFYSQILLFNMVESLRNEANEKIKKYKSLSKQKYDYTINMNILVGLFRSRLVLFALEEDDAKREKMYEGMFDKIIKNLCVVKLNRKNPRIPYRGYKKHHLNLRRNC